MLKTVEEISATKKRLHVEIPADAFETEITSAINRLRMKAKLPGFRPGRAPVSIIEKRFGKEAEAEAIEKVIPHYYSLALKEADIVPVANPVLEGGLDFKRKSPINITFLVETRPNMEGLLYEGVKVKEVKIEVRDSDVEETLERLRQEKAVYEPSDGPASEGDLVVMDYEVKDGGKAFKDEVFKVGSDMMPPAFSENIKGMAKSATAEFDVAFPEDYYSKEAAGKTLGFRVTVKEIKKASPPPMDDELAKDLGHESLDVLRGHVRKRLEASRDETVRRLLKAGVIRNILDSHGFEAPTSLVEAELETLLAEARAGGGVPEEALREKLAPEAVRRVRAALLLQAVAEKEGVSASEDEMKERIAQVSARLNISPENVVKYYVARDGSLEGLRRSIVEDKVLDLLLDRAVLEKGD